MTSAPLIRLGEESKAQGLGSVALLRRSCQAADRRDWLPSATNSSQYQDRAEHNGLRLADRQCRWHVGDYAEMSIGICAIALVWIASTSV